MAEMADPQVDLDDRSQPLLELLVRTLHHAATADLGFEPERVQTVTVDPRVLGVDAEDGPAFFGELQARLAGLLLALLATRFLESLLFGVEPADPLTFGAVAAFLAGVALLASWLPARRVTAIDPTVAMRGDG